MHHQAGDGENGKGFTRAAIASRFHFFPISLFSLGIEGRATSGISRRTIHSRLHFGHAQEAETEEKDSARGRTKTVQASLFYKKSLQ